MKQTPLQVLIKLIEDRMSLYPDNPSLSERGSYDAYLNVLNEAYKLLPYEQECIENAYHTAEVKLTEHLKVRLGSNNKEQPNRESAKRYFNETYIKNNQ